jgi:hypothetical protein
MRTLNVAAGAALAALLVGCGSGEEILASARPPQDGGADADTEDAASPGFDAAGYDASVVIPDVWIDPGPAPDCENLQCQQFACPGAGTTSLSGTVYDPAGNNPLFGVVVYVPNKPVQALPSGASCDACNALFTGEPIAATTTDATGKFTLKNVPAGSNIPVVVQVGRWRRQYSIASVAQCQDNPQPDHSLRLPRSRAEGDIPKIAISTGEADTLECLLRRVGIDASEYSVGAAGPGRIHIYQGSPRVDDRGRTRNAPNTSPAAPSSPSALWNTAQNLMAYDILLLSCEGQETSSMNQQALHDYASAGGRVFASHFHYSWFNTGPYGSENLATWTTGSNSIDGDVFGDIVTTLPNGQPFPKGQALHDWLAHIRALENGKLRIEEARHNADVSAANTPSQPWIVADQASQAPGATQYFSFNTPTDGFATPDGPSYCGRVVYSDLHVGAASGDNAGAAVPTGCANRKLSPQEAVLEYMLFDLSSCVTTEDRPPQPPPVLAPI